jgi:hypothetical protein
VTCTFAACTPVFFAPVVLLAAVARRFSRAYMSACLPSPGLKRIGMQIADLTTQHYVNNGVPDFHTRMAELEAEHGRVSALPREKPKVRRIAIGKTFRQRWEEMDDEQRHAYLKSTGVHALVVRNEDFTMSMVSEQGTQAADDVVLDIPMNVVTDVGDKWVVSIGLGTLREQLQHVEAI